MSQVRSSRTHRPWGPILLFVPIGLLILTLAACLPVPLSEPDAAKLDQQLTGAWIEADESGDRTMMVFMPYDGKTHVVRIMRLAKNEDDTLAVKPGEQVYKAWVTELGHARFLNLQMLYLPSQINKRSDVPPFLVARYDLGQGGKSVSVRGLDADSEMLRPFIDKKNRVVAIPAGYETVGVAGSSLKEIEAVRMKILAVIQKHIDNDDLYQSADTYRRVEDKAILDLLFEESK